MASLLKAVLPRMPSDLRTYGVGMVLASRDTEMKWLPATIVAVNEAAPRSFVVHYIGWSSRWDETYVIMCGMVGGRRDISFEGVIFRSCLTVHGL